MNTDVLTTKVTEGIAVITLGSPKRMYFDAEMGDMLTEKLQEFAGDPSIRVVILTGGAPGYFNRHFSIPALIEFAEAVRASGREWPDNATYHGGFFDKNRRGRRLPDRFSRSRNRPAARCRRHSKAATHYRNGGGPNAHPHGTTAQSARRREEGPRA